MPTRNPSLIILGLLIAACGGETGTPDADRAAPGVAGAVIEAPAEAPPPALRTAAPDGARVFFITPADGDTVSGPFTVEFGIEGMQVVRAGDDTPDSGHHHLLVDAELPDLGLPVPADSNHIHFGDASTSTELDLPAGQHTLQLLLGDHLHIPHDPPVVSERITITVE
jgi:hypothetical protein